MRLLRTQLCLCGRRAVVHSSCIPPLDAEAELKTRLVNSIESNSKFCKLKVIFWLKCKFNSLFHYKDTLQKKIPSNNIYKYTCSNCKATYYSKTCRQFLTRAAEHMGVSNLKWRRSSVFIVNFKHISNLFLVFLLLTLNKQMLDRKTFKQLAVSNLLLICDCSMDFDHFDNLACDVNNLRLQDYQIMSVKAIWLRHLFIEFHHAQACCHGNIESDWIGIGSVF